MILLGSRYDSSRRYAGWNEVGLMLLLCRDLQFYFFRLA
jgi:hypothetical protein